MSCCSKRMNRCECHEVPFSEILDYSRLTGVQDLDLLASLLGFGQTCTACHCDVKELLQEQEAARIGKPAAKTADTEPSFS